jgi:glycosyltransferase involved in cell wall biosynthesis
MTCSLVITTYNWKEALEQVLLSALSQSRLPDEIIIADDGSREDTKDFLNNFSLISEIPIIHSWQEDKGFRAARSRNLAISKVKCEYIILIDGDIILHHHFIKDHLSFAQKGSFVQGGRVLLGKSLSNQLLKEKNINISFFEKEIKNRKNAIYSNLLSSLFSKESQSLKGIKTCNMAFFQEDFVLVNGFNNHFVGWGREDSEFVVRLMNAGIKRRNLKFHAIAYHIWHNENSRQSLESNDNLLEKTLKYKLTSCEDGVGEVVSQ